MSHGFQEVRTVKMEPGPDGKLVPNVYIDRRPLSAEEAQEIMKEQEKLFSGFESMFSGMDGAFQGFDKFWKDMSERARTFMKKKHGEENMGHRG